MDRVNQLKNFLNQNFSIDFTYLQSRVHPLCSFSFTKEQRFFAKREDELGFGISGSKKRKYASLIPFLLQEKIEHVSVLGGAYSNNVLGLCHILIENKISFTLFLMGQPPKKIVGNYLLTSLFCDAGSIQWIDKKNWSQIEQLVQAYEQQFHKDKQCFLIQEGASIKECLPGAMTLALDCVRNEKEHNIVFDHLFIDAGTGMMAAVFILLYSWLQKNTCIHVLHLAEEEKEFHRCLEYWKQELEKLLDETLAYPQNFYFYRPVCAKSFGSVNQTILKQIAFFARNEGFLTDPIYSVKLFENAKEIALTKNLQGNLLIIHSGGLLSLMGYQEHLLAYC